MAPKFVLEIRQSLSVMRPLLLASGLVMLYFAPPAAATNFTLITVSTADQGRSGFMVTNPVYDILIEMLQQAYPVVFDNFTHYFLRLGRENLSDVSLLDQEDTHGPEGCAVSLQNAVQMLSVFYYGHPHLFGPLTENFPIITSDECADVCIELANFGAATSTFLGMHATMQSLSNNVRFPTTLSLFGIPSDYFSYTLGYLARTCSWTQMNVVYRVVEENGFMVDQRRYFTTWLRHDELDVRFISLPESAENADKDVEFGNVWAGVVQRRVTVLLLDVASVRRFLIQAYKRNLTDGDYVRETVFVTFGIRGTPSRDNILWRTGDVDDQIALLAFRALLIVQDGGDDWSGTAALSLRIRTEFTRRYGWTIEDRDLATIDAIRAYEWMEVFAETFLRLAPRLATLTVEEFVKNVTNHTYNLSFRSFYLDEIGTMIVPVPIMRLDPHGTFRTVITFSVPNKMIQFLSSNFDWFGNATLPGDLPSCGLHGEQCLSKESIEVFSVALPTMAVLFTAVVIAIVYYVRKKTAQEKILHLLIDENQVKVVESETGKNLTEQQEQTIVSDLKVGVMGKSAVYRQKSVFVKLLDYGRHNKKFTRTQQSVLLGEILTISRQHHQNLADFLGIIVLDTTYKMIYERPTKGDVLTLVSHSFIFSDMDLRLSFMANIIEGLHFIHTSQLKFHGALVAEMCLLTDRYMLKIAQAGFSQLTTLLSHDAKAELHEKRDITGLQQASDIFAFGQIMTSLFHSDNTATVQHQKTASTLQEIINNCLSRDPLQRPTANQLKLWTHQIGLLNRNVVELLLSRLKGHADELENEVGSRTQALLEERRKLDELLQEMLPRLIITKLRNNETVEAEYFASATVLFSDIPVFGRIVAECNPLDVISFLGQIHSAFDQIVSQFDVYKVETINDSYVAVSGLPTRNGQKHASEICRLALQLRTAGSAVHIPSWGDISPCPRLGVNSGPLAAGVVGQRMPRYCLFGDTMNTASRMESHGAANKVHVSVFTRDLVCATVADHHGSLQFVPRGLTTIKGKGSIETFWLTSGSNP